MSLIFPKKEILYAPMLSTFGGGSARGFGQRGGGKSSPVFGYSVGVQTSGTHNIMLFDPETMERLDLFDSGAGVASQNVVVDDTYLFNNYGYNSTDVDRYLKTDLAQGASQTPPHTTFSAAANSRSAIAVDATKIYMARNDGYGRYLDKQTGGSSNNTYLGSGGEVYGVAVDNNYAYFGGSANNGTLKIVYRSNFNNLNTYSANNFSTISSIVTDEDAVYFTGYGGNNGSQNLYKLLKSNFSTAYYGSHSIGSGTAGGYTNAVAVDGTYAYTCGYNSNFITKWNKSTMGPVDTCVVNGLSIPRFGTSNITVAIDHAKGLITDTDNIYVAAETNVGRYLIKIDKATMSAVACLEHPTITQFNFWSGGRHITLDNQEGGGMFWYRNAISDWNINDNASQILV
jgi:hypothetical protein